MITNSRRNKSIANHLAAVNKAFIPCTDLGYCEEMGYAAEKYGANAANCSLKIFRTPEGTKAWEAGVRRAKREKENGKK